MVSGYFGTKLFVLQAVIAKIPKKYESVAKVHATTFTNFH